MDFAKARCPECQRQMVPVRASCPSCNIHLEGHFELSPLARLSPEEQVFVIAFLRSHGSLKAIAEQFGISYPTVKSRLGSIVANLDQEFTPPDSTNLALLEKLQRGEVDVEQVLGSLR